MATGLSRETRLIIAWSIILTEETTTVNPASRYKRL